MTKYRIVENKIVEIYDIKSQYIKFNKLYFDNKLPINIEVSFQKASQGYRVAGGGAYEKREGRNIVGVEKIKLSTLDHIYDDEILNELYDEILIHEMCHAWIFETIGNVKMNHGQEFKDKIKEINRKRPFKFLNMNKFTETSVPSKYIKQSYFDSLRKEKTSKNMIG
jgi:hypothetical protein